MCIKAGVCGAESESEVDRVATATLDGAEDRLDAVRLRLKQGFYDRPEVLAEVARRLEPVLLDSLPGKSSES